MPCRAAHAATVPCNAQQLTATAQQRRRPPTCGVGGWSDVQRSLLAAGAAGQEQQQQQAAFKLRPVHQPVASRSPGLLLRGAGPARPQSQWRPMFHNSTAVSLSGEARNTS